MVFFKESFFSDRWKVPITILSSTLEENIQFCNPGFEMILFWIIVLFYVFLRGVGGVSWMSFFHFNNLFR